MIRDLTQVDQQSFHLLTESVPDYAIFLMDDTGCIVSWNKGAEQIKGYKADEIIGEHISIFYTREQQKNDEPMQNLRRARELERFETEGWRVRKDGSAFWASAVFTALKNEQGQLIGFGEVTRDLTKRKTAEEEINRLNTELHNQLRKSRSEISEYKHALDEACIVAITDQKGIIKHVNRNFCKISKYSEEELIGQDHRIINSGFHSKEFIRDLWVTIANGKIWRGELRNRAKDGSFYWVDTTIIPFLNEKGKPFQYLAIRSDITQRKLFEEQILQINEDLEQKIQERTLELTNALERQKELNEMKSRFVSLASHEFRTPLSAILSSVSLTEHYLAPEHEEKRKKHIDRIRSSVKNMTTILNDFLSVEKLEHGKVEIKCVHFNLKQFIEDVIEDMEGALKKKNQELIFYCSGIEEVYQDKNILLNILFNLLSNAVKYSHEGQDIELIAEGKQEDVIISVKDKGIGIPQEAQKELFDKFFRAGNVSNIQGTGLGLNIVKKYIEILGGRIDFFSHENEGSTFTIEFPRIKL
jgi:PAS domain S-box-containing protein